MKLEIRDKKRLYLDGEKIFETDIKIYKAEQFDENRIIMLISTEENDLLCIDKTGQILWCAESVTPKVYTQYQAFDIKDGNIFASAEVGGMGYDAKLDPNTGKILEKKIER